MFHPKSIFDRAGDDVAISQLFRHAFDLVDDDDDEANFAQKQKDP